MERRSLSMLCARAAHAAAKHRQERLASPFSGIHRATHHAIERNVARFAAIHRYFFITD
jgi:hypothetical protein